jgi:hypothetical protein
MKIGILTFHEVFNPGAFLQALATQRLVESLGHEAKIIDYTPEAHRYSFGQSLKKLSWRLPFRLLRALETAWKDAAFRSARKSLMNLTPRYQSRDEIASERFDAVLVGADVVWNFILENYGKDPVYFGHGLNTDRLISFAPSFGPCSSEDSRPEYVERGLRKFTALSVRDKNSQAIVKSAIDVEAKIICDPAFHLDQTQLLKPCDENEPFILIYALPQYMDIRTVDEIKSFAKERGLKTVATLYRQKWVDSNRIAEGPLEWLGLIDRADYVFTNTFHGIVFCTKMKKRFAFQYTPSIRSKSLYTVDKLGLEPLLVEKKRRVEDAFTIDHDFATADRQIDHLTEDAKAYLVEALG